MNSPGLAARFGRHRRRICQVIFALGMTYMLVGSATTGLPAASQVVQAAGQSGELVKFKTDACGDLTSIQGRHSNLIKSSAIAEPDGDDDDDSTSAWGMSDEDWAISKQWMLQHPDMAVETDAVQRSCAIDPTADDEIDDEDGLSDIA